VNITILIAFFVMLVISGVFSMFGKGGGSLYTPVLVMLGWEVGKAISTAIFLNFVTALVATFVFMRNRLVDFKFSLIFIPGTIVGSILGAMLSSRAPKDVLLGIFAVFLFGVGILMVSTKGETKQPVRSISLGIGAGIVAFSFAVGVLSSLIGVGGGLIIFPFLVLYMKYPAQKAAGANSFIVTISSIVGTIGHFTIGQHIEYLLIGVTTVAVIIGSAIGSHITVKASPSFVKVAFAVIMWFFAIEISLHLLKII